jgi:hypothetical protein
MNREVKFVSCLGPVLARYLEFKLSVGLKFDSASRVLLQLDRFLSPNAHAPEDARPDLWATRSTSASR